MNPTPVQALLRSLLVDRSTKEKRCGKKMSCPLLTPLAYFSPIAVGALFGATFSANRWIAVPRNAVNVGVSAGRAFVIGSRLAFR